MLVVVIQLQSSKFTDKAVRKFGGPFIHVIYNMAYAKDVSRIFLDEAAIDVRRDIRSRKEVHNWFMEHSSSGSYVGQVQPFHLFCC